MRDCGMSDTTIGEVCCNLSVSLQNMFTSNRIQTVRGYSRNIKEEEKTQREKTGLYTFITSCPGTRRPSYSLEIALFKSKDTLDHIKLCFHHEKRFCGGQHNPASDTTSKQMKHKQRLHFFFTSLGS